MQDRFKFRFWHKPTNKMLDCYGFNEHCTFANTLDGIGTEYNPCATKDCELMQCTGLKDNNGKLIYEGDICRNSKSGEIFNVVWHNPLASFCWQKHEHTYIYSYGELFRAFDYYEVIGNIYENPELLEVSNDH